MKNDTVIAKLSPGELFVLIKDKNDLKVQDYINNWLKENPDGIVYWVDNLCFV